MKKRIASLVLAAFVTIAMGLALIGCGPGMPDYAGTYQLSSMEVMGMTLSGSDLETAMESAGGIEEQYVEIKDGRTLVLNMSGSSEEITYTADGNSLNFQDVSGPSSFVLEGDKLVWTVSAEQAAEAVPGMTSGFTMEFTKK